MLCKKKKQISTIGIKHYSIVCIQNKASVFANYIIKIYICMEFYHIKQILSGIYNIENHKA